MKIPFLSAITATAITLNGYSSSISVNFFESGLPYQKIEPHTAAGIEPAAHWNNLPNKSGTQTGLLDSSGEMHTVTISWSAPGFWEDAEAINDAQSGVGNAQLLSGYLDDNIHTPGPTVKLSNLPYQNYKVILYLSTDVNGDTFSPPTINGQQAPLAAAKTRYQASSPFTRGNTILMEQLTGYLTITFPSRSNGIRSTLAGFQVIDSTPPNIPETLLSLGAYEISLIDE